MRIDRLLCLCLVVRCSYGLSTTSAASSKIRQPKILETLQPILGRDSSHGATRPMPSLEWCRNHVETIRPTVRRANQGDTRPSADALCQGDGTVAGPFDNSNSHRDPAVVHILQKVWSADMCQALVQAAEDHGKWSTGRHHLYPTTDIPVRDLPEEAQSACLALAQGVILPSLARIFEDNSIDNDNISSLPSSSLDHLNFKDMFVAKYTPTGQPGLGAHTDGSAFSFNVLLSRSSSDGKLPADFEGGGTSFEGIGRVSPSQGDVLVHRGSLRHEGNAVIEGCRYILVGFVDSDPNFARITSTKHGLPSKLRSRFHTIALPSFPLGIVLEVDEGDGNNSAVMVISCDTRRGSAFPSGIRAGDCIRGILLPCDAAGDDAGVQLELWDGMTFDDVMERLKQLPVPLELVVERWNTSQD